VRVDARLNSSSWSCSAGAATRGSSTCATGAATSGGSTGLAISKGTENSTFAWDVVLGAAGSGEADATVGESNPLSLHKEEKKEGNTFNFSALFFIGLLSP